MCDSGVKCGRFHGATRDLDGIVPERERETGETPLLGGIELVFCSDLIHLTDSDELLPGCPGCPGCWMCCSV